jgi:hypothetical protein
LTPEVSLVINEPEFESTPSPGMKQVAGPLGAFGTSSIQPRRVTVFDDGLAANVHAIISIMSAEVPDTTFTAITSPVAILSLSEVVSEKAPVVLAFIEDMLDALTLFFRNVTVDELVAAAVR